jgi:uncharacterized membrane protein
MEDFKQNISIISDINELKRDVSKIQADMIENKTTLKEIKNEMNQWFSMLKEDISDLNTSVAIHEERFKSLMNVQGDVTEFMERMNQDQTEKNKTFKIELKEITQKNEFDINLLKEEVQRLKEKQIWIMAGASILAWIIMLFTNLIDGKLFNR